MRSDEQSVVTDGPERESGDADPLLDVTNVKKHFRLGEGFVESLLGEKEYVKAVDGVSLRLQEQETFGLVGESGCGKSTLGRTLLRLEKPTAGSISFRGTDLAALSTRELRRFRSEIQFIHQDPSSSLNPRKRIEQILRRPLELHTSLDDAARAEEIGSLLERVGLDSEMRQQYPHELSGGQKQRVEIARAISVNPSFIVADEPTSALDVTVQAQILELLSDIQEQLKLTMVFISHDLRTVRYVSDRVGVMYLGELIEVGPTNRIFDRPRHPYTQSLLSAVPEIGSSNGERVRLDGQPPDPINPPNGCRFHTRCPLARDVCEGVRPVEVTADDDHTHRCHFSNADIRSGIADEPVEHVRNRVESESPEVDP